jgi:aconitate hydratase
MIFDIEMISSFYRNMPSLLAEIRKVLNRPLTVSEKILYTHLYPGNTAVSYKRGADYVDFAPDRVAMQDATAQMALLQFMMAGKQQTAVPSSVHCDHLIMAKSGAEADMKTCLPRRYDDRNRLSHSQCGRSGNGSNRSRRRRCCRCDDWHGVGVEASPSYRDKTHRQS